MVFSNSDFVEVRSVLTVPTSVETSATLALAVSALCLTPLISVRTCCVVRACSA